MIDQFLLDGKPYNVHVLSLQRSFSIKDTITIGSTMSGEIYRDPVGTYYNYSMTISRKGSDQAAMDAFWDAISAPVNSHVCVFPYNQDILTQKMYVTDGMQDIQRIYENRIDWRDITIQFYALAPKVVPE